MTQKKWALFMEYLSADYFLENVKRFPSEPFNILNSTNSNSAFWNKPTVLVKTLQNKCICRRNDRPVLSRLHCLEAGIAVETWQHGQESLASSALSSDDRRVCWGRKTTAVSQTRPWWSRIAGASAGAAHLAALVFPGAHADCVGRL